MAGWGEGRRPVPRATTAWDGSKYGPHLASSNTRCVLGSPALTCHPSPAQGRPHFHRQGIEGDAECQAWGHCALGWRRGPAVWSRPGAARGGLGGCARHRHGDLRCPQLPCCHQGRKAGHPAQDHQVSPGTSLPVVHAVKIRLWSFVLSYPGTCVVHLGLEHESLRG